ncbi:MAG: AMP-binding protein [Candidatus Afipia apatlaquensis]|uniref:3-methylmercaptopropionyl-CoA ligase n=1 Tax=Candidatus Afipia apatlaquensis TaxID=2712852 RepID=A0A7C9RGR9_9BRAD|nr:AMP-binding protein [Candidatus Afipia apatlaquensis]
MAFIYDTIGNYIDKVCDKYPDKEILIYPEGNIHYNYHEFINLCNSLAKGLIKLGIKKGDHVAILSLNSPEYIALIIATAKIGAILVYINANYGKNEFEYVLKHSDCTTLFLTNGFKDINFIDNLYSICPELKNFKPGELKSNKFPYLKNVIFLDNISNKNMFNLEYIIKTGKDVQDSVLQERSLKLKSKDIINIQYTSGTTGNPKAVMINHYSILNNAFAVGKNLKYSSEDKLLLCLPLFHVMGCALSAILCLMRGAVLVVIDRFKTSTVLEYLSKEKCTAFNGVPTMFKFILNYPELQKADLSSLKKGFIAGSYCNPNLVLNIMNKMNMKELTTLYGQTEGLTLCQNICENPMDKKVNTVGKALPGIETKIVNPNTGKEVTYGILGELLVKGIYIMDGYYKNIEATNKAIDTEKWLHTGDLAVKDKEGFIRLIGRIKDIIIRGGENISSTEIEEYLISHPAVKQAAVVGVPDEKLGEEICAFIIPNDEVKVTKEELIKFVKDNLAKYKVPKYIAFVDEFPTTSSGKVKKYMLKDTAVELFNLNNVENMTAASQ